MGASLSNDGFFLKSNIEIKKSERNDKTNKFYQLGFVRLFLKTRSSSFYVELVILFREVVVTIKKAPENCFLKKVKTG